MEPPAAPAAPSARKLNGCQITALATLAILGLALAWLAVVIYRTVEDFLARETFFGVFYVVCNTLDGNQMEGYDLVRTVRERMPDIPCENGRVLDRWGRPIDITWEPDGDYIFISMHSVGRDGVAQTKDDLDQKFRMNKNFPKQ